MNCKRCELGYIHNGGKIEDIKEGKIWVKSEDNVLWFVCEKCAEAVTYVNMALKNEDPKHRLLRQRKAYLRRFTNES